MLGSIVALGKLAPTSRMNIFGTSIGWLFNATRFGLPAAQGKARNSRREGRNSRERMVLDGSLFRFQVNGHMASWLHVRPGRQGFQVLVGHTRHVGSSFASVFAIFLVFALSACHGPAKRIVGRWTIREFDKISVEFKPDDSFVFTGALGGMRTQITGNYAEVGNQLTLTATHIQVKSAELQPRAAVGPFALNSIQNR